MQKATLTGRQRGSAVFAGIFGHLLFAAGWLVLGFGIVGGLLTLVFGGTIGSIAGLFGDVPVVNDFLANAGGVLTIVAIVLGVIAIVLILLGVLVSGWILKGGTVRRPWATTWSAIAIVAILDIPLFFVYFVLAGKLTDTKVSGPFFLGPFVGIIGTIVVGVLVWLWMTWGHRGSASEFAGISTSASGTASVEAAEPTAAVEAPAAEPAKAPAKATAPKAPAAKKPTE